MNLEKKHELMLLRLRYLKKDLEYTEETEKDAQAAFSISFNFEIENMQTGERDFLKNILIKKEEIRKKAIDSFASTRKRVRPKPIAKTERQNKQVKKLFKEVAKASHPDATLNETEEVQERRYALFKLAQEASENSEYFASTWKFLPRLKKSSSSLKTQSQA